MASTDKKFKCMACAGWGVGYNDYELKFDCPACGGTGRVDRKQLKAQIIHQIPNNLRAIEAIEHYELNKSD